MPYDLSDKLVIGISSRALFDLEVENAIYDQQGVD
ncbi:5'-nucleotidase, partial [Acinetobacter baumannii]